MTNKKFIIKPILIISILISVLTNSCKDTNPYDVDLSRVIEEPVIISRYEVALFEANPYDLLKDLEPYQEEFSFFIGEGLQTEQGQQQLFDFVTDRFLQELYFDVTEKYTDLTFLETELSKAFRYYRYYYKDQANPKIFTYVSGLDSEMPIKYAEGNIIIGLDMYLGRQYLNYERAGVSAFRRLSCSKEYITADIMKVMAEINMQSEINLPSNFLDFIIYEGKTLYFLDLMLPNTPDSIKINYTTHQIRWMEKNSKNAWAYFIDNELLFTQDRQIIRKFVGDAPFTAVFGHESAPRAGVWFGWQIVREFMRRNPDISIQQLLLELKPQEILNKSAYKPK
ncbi:MAG: hypothetical protein KGZ85_15145 [Ignavibacterium sp.]|nr:hypothetical protein [Ignavibacterium sp.]